MKTEGEKDYNKWTRKEFESLPTPTSYTNQEVGEVDSLIILPEKYYHDSGYRCMSFVTIQNGKPTYKISGCSDVINLGGIGGFNIRYYTGNLTYQERIREKKHLLFLGVLITYQQVVFCVFFVIKKYTLVHHYHHLKYFLRRGNYE